VGVPAPAVLNGVPQKPIEGVSMVYSFDDARAPSRRRTQYFEMLGNRTIYNDGWIAATTPPVAPWVVAGPKPDVDETLDFGEDTGTPVSADYAVPFRFTGTLNRVLIRLSDAALTAEDEAQIRRARMAIDVWK
jgi:arylsulfatase A-like enzyme